MVSPADLPEHYDPAWFSPRVFEDPEAFASAYDELRSIARYLLRGEQYSPTLQATELVNQAFLKLCSAPYPAVDRDHFLALLSRYMRQVLIDRARRRNADKRAGIEIPLDAATDPGAGREPAWERVDAELAQLAAAQPLLARVFELHYFAGLSMRDLAHHLGCSERTVKRYWRAARAWLSDRLRESVV